MALIKTAIPGIFKRTDNNGEVSSYAVRYYVPGPPGGKLWVQQQASFTRLQTAKDFKRDHVNKVRDGDYSPPNRSTVEEVCGKWLESGKLRWRTSTYLGHEGQVKNYFVPELGRFKATNVKTLDVETAARAWNKRVDYTTANRLVGVLNAVYKFARKLGIKNNPCRDVERLRPQVDDENLEAMARAKQLVDRAPDAPKPTPGFLRAIRADQVYSADELRRLIEAAEAGLARLLLMVAILCGLRPGEVTGLTWPTIDLREGTVWVKRSMTQLPKKLGGMVLSPPKTKSGYRQLKLPAELVGELRRWKNTTPPNKYDLVFTNELGEPLRRKRSNAILAAACKKAGIDRVLSMNNLRHSFASQNLLAGISPLQVSQLMGHANPSVTLTVYSRWTNAEQSNAAVVLASRIFNADPATLEVKPVVK